MLGRLGWKPTTFQPGDRVQADFNPPRDTDEHGGSLKTIMSLDTGKTYSTNLREQEDLGAD